MNDTTPKPTKVDIISSRRVFEGWFRIDEVHYSFVNADGFRSQEHRAEIIQQPDVATALLYDPNRREVVCLDIFRITRFQSTGVDGWQLEPLAAYIRPGQTPEAALVQVVLDETGSEITHITPIATFLAAPNVSSERVFLYYAEVHSPEHRPSNVAKTDDARIERIDIQSFFRKLMNREFEDQRLIMAAQWLKEHLAGLPSETAAETSKPNIFRLREFPNKTVGYKTGNILATRDVDVWVNFENTNMIMDRFFERSLSSQIRLSGAERYPEGDRIVSDTIADALRERLGGRLFVKVGTVLDTPPGELARTHSVKRLFHVAAVVGPVGPQRELASLSSLEMCIDNALQAIDRSGTWHNSYQSVLIPVPGISIGGFTAHEVVPRIVLSAIRFLSAHPRSRLSKIYFLGSTIGETNALESALREAHQLEPFNDGELSAR